jgi:Peptidase C65 Otubain
VRVILRRVDDNGWHVEIGAVDAFDGEEVRVVGVASLRDSDHISVRSSRDNLGCRASLQNLISNFRYNESMRRKVVELGSQYAGWRSIRGDGNYYYRSVVYGTLENIVLTKNKEAYRYIYRCRYVQINHSD